MILAIYCAGGLGQEVIAVARAVTRWEQIYFVDDICQERMVCGASVFKFEEIEAYRGDIEFVIANGEPSVRKKLYQKIKEAGYPLTTILGWGCSVLNDTVIGEGCVIYDCGISHHVTIEPNVLINTRVIIGHNAIIREHCVISANCFIGGLSEVETGSYLAPGVMLKDRIRIGEESILGLGAVALRSVKPKSIMVGNPAKRIGENSEGSIFGMFV